MLSTFRWSALMATSSAPLRTLDVLLWDVTTAADRTGLTPRYIRRLIAERRIPTVKLGRLVRIRPDDLRAYIDANVRPATRSA